MNNNNLFINHQKIKKIEMVDDQTSLRDSFIKRDREGGRY